MRLPILAFAAALAVLPRVAAAQTAPPATDSAAAATPAVIPTVDERQLAAPLRPADNREVRTLLRRYMPASLVRAGGAAEVRVRVVVDEEGKVSEAEVEGSSGQRDIDRAALEVARRLHFPRPLLNSAPVRVRMSVPVAFMVNRDEAS